MTASLLAERRVRGTEVGGSIRVTTATTGVDLDRDGYLVTVDGLPAQLLGVNATVTVEGLREGTHTVSLTRVATNCVVGGSNPQSISVTSGAETSVSFGVTCVRTYVEVSAGFDFTCARTAAGAAYCWGWNANGQLGDGTSTMRLVPTPVSGSLTFSQVSAGVLHSCGRCARPGSPSASRRSRGRSVAT